MAGLYVDTSALGRVMLAEPDAQLIRDTMAQYEALWSSTLLQLELRRLARREGVEEHADELLAAVRTRRLDSESLRRAAELEPAEVRALDAIHLDAAIQLRKRGRYRCGTHVRSTAQSRLCASRARGGGAGPVIGQARPEAMEASWKPARSSAGHGCITPDDAKPPSRGSNHDRCARRFA